MTTKLKIKLPTVDLKAVSSCHALQPVTSEGGGEGYDPDPQFGCAKCPDKTTCLSALLDNTSKNKARDVPLALKDADNETQAVFAGVITNDEMIERISKRGKLEKSGGTIPTELSADFDLIGAAKAKKAEAAKPAAEEKKSEPPPAAEAASDEPEAKDDEAQDADTTDTKNDDKSDETKTEDTMGTKKNGKKSGSKKTPKAKAAARPRVPKKDRKRIYPNSDGPQRFLPAPRENNEEQQKAALSRIALGQDFDVAVGMEIVRKRRDGSEIVVKVVKTGFKMDGVIYSSLSAAGQHASQRAVSGNDFFNIKNYSCTEIRGEGVPGGVFSKQGKGQKAIVGAHGPGKPAAAKKGAAKKGAKKSAPPPPKKAAAKKGKK